MTGPGETPGPFRVRSLMGVLALVTALSAQSHDTDLPLLTQALKDIDAEAQIVAWDDPAVDWSSFTAAIIRSTWDYHRRLKDFTEWLDRVGSLTSIWNPVDLIRWNLDKRYLLDVAAWGLPIVPTTVIEVSDDLNEVDLTSDIVVKPAIGAGAHGARRIIGDSALARAHAEALLSSGTAALVQPYLSAVDSDGETGVVAVGGMVSHAFAKGAILTGDPTWTDDLYVTEQIAPRVASPAEQDIVDRILRQLPLTAYARIDLLPTVDGPVVSEIELIEPSLFLHVDPRAAQRAATAFVSLTSR